MNELHEHCKPFRYFCPRNEKPGPTATRPERLRVAIITSVRDLVSEGVGMRKHGIYGEETYLKGTLEYAIEQSVRGKLAHYLELVLVITDDTERDMTKLGGIVPVKPQRERPWIHPLDMRLRSGDLATSATRNIPSDYRLLPLHDKERRASEKKKFEDRIRGAMEMHQAQVLISDHFLCRVEHLIDERYCDLKNRVLNTHPGISDRRHRFRTPGVTPYADAMKRASGNAGEKHDRTGASFHIMSAEIDAGPVIVDVERTPIYRKDTWEDVCARNYPLSKNPAFAEGIIHYAAHVFPRLGSIDLHALEPLETDSAVYDHVA